MTQATQVHIPSQGLSSQEELLKKFPKTMRTEDVIRDTTLISVHIKILEAIQRQYEDKEKDKIYRDYVIGALYDLKDDIESLKTPNNTLK